MSEKRAFSLLKQSVLGAHLNRRLDRIENSVGSGWPDANGCFEGIEFWIEVKEPEEPKRASTPLFGSSHKLGLEQRNWIKRQLNAGGLVYIYIDTGKNRMLISGALADVFNKMTLSEFIKTAVWHASVPIRNAEKWEEIAHVIANRTL